MTNNHKIIIKDRSFILNTGRLEIELRTAKIIINPRYSHFYLSKHKNQYHQVILNEKKTGYCMTTAPFIRDSSNNKVESLPLSLHQLEQRFTFSTFDNNYNNEDLKPGYLGNFFLKNQIIGYESFCGFLIRLDIMAQIEFSEILIFQKSSNELLTKKPEEKQMLLKTVAEYHRNFFFGNSKQQAFLEKSTKVVYSAEDLQRFTKIRSLLFETSDKDLFIIILKNDFLNESLSEFKLAYKNAFSEKSN